MNTHIDDISTLGTAFNGPSTWGTLRYETSASPCATGISIDFSQITTDAVPDSKFVEVAGSNNTIHVAPSWNGVTATPGLIKASFRLGNWGSQIGVPNSGSTLWTPAFTFSDLLADPVDATRKDNTNSGAGVIDVTCTNGDPTRPCPSIDLSTQNHDQCMFVQLQATVGNTATFSRDSTYRNLDFESSSLMSRDATISIAGLAPLDGRADRDVYVAVQTVNMPSQLERATELPRQLMAEVRRAPAPVPVQPQDGGVPDGGESPGVGREMIAKAPPKNSTAPVVPDRTSFERIASVWPTYQVHAYHELERWTDKNGMQRVRLAEGIPFGYFVDHAGALYGWDHAIVGLEGAKLQPLAANYYRVSIPNGGSVKVNTAVLAKESPGDTIASVCRNGRCPGQLVPCRCGCKLIGASSTRLAGWLAGFALLSLAALRVMRRRVRGRAR